MVALNRFCNLCSACCLFRISLQYSAAELPNAWPTSLSLTVDCRFFCAVCDLGFYLPSHSNWRGVLATADAGRDSVPGSGVGDVWLFALARGACADVGAVEGRGQDRRFAADLW